MIAVPGITWSLDLGGGFTHYKTCPNCIPKRRLCPSCYGHILRATTGMSGTWADGMDPEFQWGAVIEKSKTEEPRYTR